jgi:predicted LPLAT superfamily acyltransferase
MPHWRDRPEGGNRFWLTVIQWIILRLGRGFALASMFPTTLYFFIVRREERRASRRWLELVEAPRRGVIGVLIHIYTFAMTIVDRVLLLSGREAELEIRSEGAEALSEILKRGQGCVLLGSHLGSFEAIRVYSRQAPEACRHLRVVMDRNQNSLITRTLERINPSIRDTVIDAHQPGPQIVLQAAETLSSGGMIAMLADRVFRNETAVTADFCGQPAPFPMAPLAVAAALEAPVFLVFGLYEGRGRYRLVFEPLPAPGEIASTRREKRARLNQWVARYAQRLEYHARRYPYNWFNFYDFWNHKASPDRPVSSAGHRADRSAGQLHDPGGH